MNDVGSLSIPSDPARQKFMWVDDFSEDEANQFLDNSKFLVHNDLKRKQVFESIGTRPAMLKELVNIGEDF